MSFFEELIKPFRKIFQSKSRKKKSSRPKARKKPVKRPVKPSVKKSVRKTVKKAAKKAVKKSAKKITKKTIRKALKPKVKKAVKKTVKKKVLKKSPLQKSLKHVKQKRTGLPSGAAKTVVPENVYIGDITHYFSKIKVAVLKVASGNLQIGDTILIKGATTDFKQKVASMQIESVDVKAAKKGKLVGLKVGKDARVGDKVYKL